MSSQMPPSRGPLQPPAAMRGALDLGALAQAREQQRQAEERAAERAKAAAAGDPAALSVPAVVDATEATFQADIIDRSFEVPVVVDLWSPRSVLSKELSPLLTRLAEEAAGKWLLARVNVDAEANIAAAFRVEAIPTVCAIIQGQPVPLFQGAMAEEDIRKVLAELVRVAEQNGMTGVPVAGSEPEMAGELEEADDPRYDEAFDAFEAGDWDRAEAAYRSLLNDSPSDADASAGLIRVKIMRRVQGSDPAASIEASNANPADVAAAVLAADFEMLSGAHKSAFDRLINAVRLTADDDRAAARSHLLGLFELVGSTDPQVSAARTALANALF